MQHWHIYRVSFLTWIFHRNLFAFKDFSHADRGRCLSKQKWNESFFIENMKAFKEGRCPKDPSELWFKGEMGFFDLCSKHRKGSMQTVYEIQSHFPFAVFTLLL